jgi:serine/threonine protein kinase
MICEYSVKDTNCKFKSKFEYNSKHYCTRHYNLINKHTDIKINKITDNTEILKNILDKININYDKLIYLDKGTYNEVYEIVINNKNFIIKYQNLKNKKNILYYEYLLLQNFINNSQLIVSLYKNNNKTYFTKQNEYAILFQEKLYETLHSKNKSYTFTFNEIIEIISQLVNTIEYIHSKKYLYIDLKPDNIMFISQNSNNIKLIDFNLCEKYIDCTSNFYPNIKSNNRKGNDLFSSRNINLGYRGQRIDDIESIFYILLYLLKDELFLEIFNKKNINDIIILKNKIFNTKYELEYINQLIFQQKQ